MTLRIVFADDESDIENAFKRAMPWFGDDFGMKDTSSSIFPGLSLVQWMSMQHNNQFPAAQSGILPSMVAPSALHGTLTNDDPSKLLSFQAPVMSSPNLQFSKANQQNQVGQLPTTTWSQQQQLQQLLQVPASQQLQQQQQQQMPPQQEPQQQQQQQQSQQLPQQQQLQSQQPQRQQQTSQSALLNNGVAATNHLPNQSLQQPLVYSQLQQQQLLAGNIQSHQTSQPSNKNSFQTTSIQQETQFQPQIEQQPSLLPRHQQPTQFQQAPLQLLQQSLSQRAQQQPQVQQFSQPILSEQQLQLQLLQKLQQQQQQQQQPLLSPASPLLPPQLLQQQHVHQQNQQLPPLPLSNQQQFNTSGGSFQTEKLNSNGFSSLGLMQPQQVPMTQSHNQFKPTTAIRAYSGLTDGDAPSCSTSPSTNNCQVSVSNLLNKNQQGAATLGGDSVVEPATNLAQELQSKPDLRVKPEFPNSKGSDQLKYKGTIPDQLEASSSGTSYCLDAGTIQQTFPLPTCLDNDVQSHPRNNIPFSNSIDGLAPDTLLSRGYDSQKDLQNLLSNYGGGVPRDIETELSTAAISSQSFGVPNLPFKPGCSNDVNVNEAGALSSGLWANHSQRMRTYTKV